MKNAQEIKNVNLGNFGFLLDFGQDFLFELAQLAESNLYVNKRLCAVYIRQLCESFFDFVINDEKINVKNEQQYNTIFIKYKAIYDYYQKSQFRPLKYGKKAFPAFPAKNKINIDRFPCPEGQGDDDDKKTLYVWSFIRKIGNAASHAADTEISKSWLDEKHLKVALEQLYIRIGYYFYGKNNKVNNMKFEVDNCSLTSRSIFYPIIQEETLTVKQRKLLPGYIEKKYWSVIPIQKLKNDEEQGVEWKNYINKYFIIRKYKINNNDNDNTIRDYLLQSQRAYLLLQKNERLEGLANYHVLADLRNKADYYVASYEFENKPQDLNINSYKICGLLDDRGVKLLVLCKQFIKVMLNLTNNRIYHRILTHKSIKVCVLDNGDFKLKIIDFELVKLFEKTDEITEHLTVAEYANELSKILGENENQTSNNNFYKNLRQYKIKQWSDSTTEDEYKRQQRIRVGEILCNILCPKHFNDEENYDDIATYDEIRNSNNVLAKNISQELLKKIYELANSLFTGEKSLKQAYECLEDFTHEYE